MAKDPSFFEDMSKIAGNFMQQGFASAADMREKFDHSVKQHINQLLANSDLVSREEFEIVREMAAKARAENEALKARLDALEKNNTKTKGKK